MSKTPPLPPRPYRTTSNSSIQSINSEPAFEFSPPARTFTPERADEQSSRAKHVENWNRRLVRARQRLMAESGVEIWTWKVGSDVEEICKNLVAKEYGK